MWKPLTASVLEKNLSTSADVTNYIPIRMSYYDVVPPRRFKSLEHTRDVISDDIKIVLFSIFEQRTKSVSYQIYCRTCVSSLCAMEEKMILDIYWVHLSVYLSVSILFVSFSPLTQTYKGYLTNKLNYQSINQSINQSILKRPVLFFKSNNTLITPYQRNIPTAWAKYLMILRHREWRK